MTRPKPKEIRLREIQVGPFRVTAAALWTAVRLELLNNERVRQLCGDITRVTLLRWREGRGFPEPVLAFNVNTPRVVELWSRSEVESWLEFKAGASLDPRTR